MIYYGASLKALYRLAQKKGYAFLGGNSARANAFFVRKDLMSDSLREVSIEDGYVAGQFRESRDKEDKLICLSFQEEKEMLSTLPLVEVE